MHFGKRTLIKRSHVSEEFKKRNYQIKSQVDLIHGRGALLENILRIYWLRNLHKVDTYAFLASSNITYLMTCSTAKE